MSLFQHCKRWLYRGAAGTLYQFVVCSSRSLSSNWQQLEWWPDGDKQTFIKKSMLASRMASVSISYCLVFVINQCPYLGTNRSLFATLEGIFYADMTSLKGPQPQLACCFRNFRDTRASEITKTLTACSIFYLSSIVKFQQNGVWQ